MRGITKSAWNAFVPLVPNNRVTEYREIYFGAIDIWKLILTIYCAINLKTNKYLGAIFKS